MADIQPARAALPVLRLSGPWRWAAIVVVVPLVLLILLAAMPWGLIVGHADALASRAAGRRVSIGSARRIDHFSLTPTVALYDVRVAQPGWAGTGDMARIGEMQVRLPVLPLLVGRVRPQAVALTGMHLELRRTREGRSNWAEQRGDRPVSAGPPSILSRLTIRDGSLRLIDAGRHAMLAAMVTSDADKGLVVAGSGTLRGRPMTLRFTGAALDGVDPARPYPARLVVRSPLVSVDAALTMARPFDVKRLRASLHATGTDLSNLDDVLQAGLFPTQPFDLTASVRRDVGTWYLDRVAGRIGRSRLTARARVTDTGPRTRIDGAVDAATWDFADFASDAQRARGAAKDRATGPRVIPDIDLTLDNLRKLDGTVRLTAHRLLTDPGSPMRSLAATVTLDHRRLTVAPLRVGLVSGHADGRLVDDDRGRVPDVTVDLRVEDATIEALVLRDDAMTGPFRSRIRLNGRGGTLRAAMAHADGTVGIATVGGTIRRDYATFLGGDIVKGVGAAVAGAGPRAALRCLAGTMRARDGRVTPAPLVLDTAVSRGDGSGTVTLGDEAIDLALSGRAHDPGVLQATAPVRILGTLSAPRFDMRPPRAERESRGGLLSRVGVFLKSIRGRGSTPQASAAPHADCTALAKAALG